MADPVRCPDCGAPLAVPQDGTGGSAPCPTCRPAAVAVPEPLQVRVVVPLSHPGPANPLPAAGRDRPWPVIRIAGGIGAAGGAAAVLAQWAAGKAPPPADDVAYQVGRAVGGAIWYGLIGIMVGVLVRLALRLGRPRPTR